MSNITKYQSPLSKQRKFYDLLRFYAQQNAGYLPLDVVMSLAVSQYYRRLGETKDESRCLLDDFVTAPQLGPLFYAPLANWMFSCWQNLGSVKAIGTTGGGGSFVWLELGGGEGHLFKGLWQILSGMERFVEEVAAVIFLENSPSLAKKQMEVAAEMTAGRNGINLITVASVEELVSCLKEIGLPTIGVANEFFDALPVKQFVARNGEIESEVVLCFNAAGKGYLARRPVMDRVEESRQHWRGGDGGGESSGEVGNGEAVVIEVSPARDYVIYNLGSLFTTIPAFHLLCLDYGYEVAPQSSTIQAIRGHQRLDDPFDDEELGSADLTALVDFKALKERFVSCVADDGRLLLSGTGYRIIDRCSTQAEFLTAWGVNQVYSALCQTAGDEAELALLARQLERLVGPEEMGTLFKVLWLGWEKSG